MVAPRAIMKALAVGFLPETIDDNNYANLSSAEEASKHNYRVFLEAVLRHLLRLCRIDVIVSGNFAYFAERELHAAAEAVGIPFVILHKENLKSPARRAYFADLYRQRRGPFSGCRIIVYNATEREVQISGGIVPASQISVCGMPRLDRAHAWRRSVVGKRFSEQPTVLFFTFSAKTGLPVLRRKFGDGNFVEPLPEFDNLNWKRTVGQTMEALARFAETERNVRVVVKSKQGAGEIGMFREAAGDRVPPNVQLIDGGDPIDLLKDAWVVVGMNSTALLEALAMGKTVLCPRYAEAADPAMYPWIVDFGSAVEHIESPEGLAARLVELTNGPVPVVPAQLDQSVSDALEQWAGNSDGKASERVIAVIENELAAVRGEL